MKTNWPIVIATITVMANLLGPSLAELLKLTVFSKIKQAQKPAMNEDVQKLTQRHAGKRLLYFIFPPDGRLLLMAISFIVMILLMRQVESPAPLTRESVFYITALVGVLVIGLVIDVIVSVYKTLPVHVTPKPANTRRTVID